MEPLPALLVAEPTHQALRGVLLHLQLDVGCAVLGLNEVLLVREQHGVRVQEELLQVNVHLRDAQLNRHLRGCHLHTQIHPDRRCGIPLARHKVLHRDV